MESWAIVAVCVGLGCLIIASLYAVARHRTHAAPPAKETSDEESFVPFWF
ncbi:hypothetical protein N6L24_13730 [Cognatishimia sp. SS12]|nr:hypothetical protein [Cognatishimia sp. SS12]MDC0739343.1 hypothetical protein [Cognatishimia sp. SS12]